MIYILLLVCLGGVAHARSIVVGEGRGGWTLGIKYTPIDASINDQLIFNYTPGVHDVWSIPASDCDFAAPGARLLAAPAAGTYTTPLSSTGTFYFACSTVGHCQAGQLLQVNVRDSSFSGSKPAGLADGLLSGGGSCTLPTTDPETGDVAVSCLSAPVTLSPGDNKYPDTALPNPYPTDGSLVVLRTVASQVVDATGRAVPLSEVYLHHTFGDNRFVPGDGAEVRLSPTRVALPSQYGVIVNGSDFENQDSRMVNLHVINTVGVPADQLKPCIECWCPGSNPPVVIGSIGCCSKCSSMSKIPERDYFLQFNVTYSPATPEVLTETSPITSVALDIHGGVDYSITAEGPGAVSTTTRTYPIDYYCPQDGPFQLVRCWAHQHIGAECVTVVDEATGDTLCQSCPTYGTEPGVPGNETGYLVGMSSTLHDPPVTLQPGQVVRVEATYDAAQPYGGVMSILALQMSNFTARPQCNVPFNGFVQPPVDGGMQKTSAELLLDMQTLIATIPADSCPLVRGYFDDVVLPCLPPVLSNITGNTPAGDAMAVCCAAVKSNSGNSLADVFGSVFNAAPGSTGCVCPVGEALLYAAQQDLLTHVVDISRQCSGDTSNEVTDAASAIYVILNSAFAPQCPEIRATLDASDSTTNSSSSVSSTPASPPSSGDTVVAGGELSSGVVGEAMMTPSPSFASAAAPPQSSSRGACQVVVSWTAAAFMVLGFLL